MHENKQSTKTIIEREKETKETNSKTSGSPGKCNKSINLGTSNLQAGL